MKKLKCTNCKGSKFEIDERNSYTFIFRCVNCGDIYQISSLVDMQILCNSSNRKNDETWATGNLFNADPNCKHEIKNKWSGVKCVKCGGWFCY